MDLLEYQKKSRVTAVYPPQYKISYTALGLIGEHEEFHKALCISYDNYEALTKELGDMMWYCANLSTDLGILLIKFDGLFEIGSFAERIKKYLRDGHDKSKLELIQQDIGKCVAKVDFWARRYNTSLEHIMELNLKKLLDRQERGVLHGSGDDR
jgi:NTP pyrophosphatase (non-canonical NTP hydrolase)